MSDERDIPPDNGRRAHVLKSGEVRGAGSGAGGGNPGVEEFDTDAQGTDQIGPTGVDAAHKGTPAQGAGDDPQGGLDLPAR